MSSFNTDYLNYSEFMERHWLHFAGHKLFFRLIDGLLTLWMRRIKSVHLYTIGIARIWMVNGQTCLQEQV